MRCFFFSSFFFLWTCSKALSEWSLSSYRVYQSFSTSRQGVGLGKRMGIMMRGVTPTVSTTTVNTYLSRLMQSWEESGEPRNGERGGE